MDDCRLQTASVRRRNTQAKRLVLVHASKDRKRITSLYADNLRDIPLSHHAWLYQSAIVRQGFPVLLLILFFFSVFILATIPALYQPDWKYASPPSFIKVNPPILLQAADKTGTKENLGFGHEG